MHRSFEEELASDRALGSRSTYRVKAGDSTGASRRLVSWSLPSKAERIRLAGDDLPTEADALEMFGRLVTELAMTEFDRSATDAAPLRRGRPRKRAE